MSASAFDHPWLSGLFDAPRIAPLWAADAQARHLRAYEIAWTDALAASGRIGPDEAGAARAAIAQWQPDTPALRAGARQDGLVVPAMVRQMRAGLAAPHAVHTGSTSQDVLDTVLALTLREVTTALEAELAQLVTKLDQLSAAHGAAPLMARTRMQAALPSTTAHRLAAWRGPLAAARHTIPVLPLQFGGAAGDGQALGADADTVAAHLAQALKLPRPRQSWQTDRGPILDHGTWLARVTGALGKLGQDVALMAQQGVDEIGLRGGGSSSAMAHKQNPIEAETLVALARYTAGQLGTLAQSLVHEQERSGAAWTLEWLVLPPMTMAAGAATGLASDLLGRITRLGSAP